jgi:Holliday junction resolvasome RuvABC endonuclease subunit
MTESSKDILATLNPEARACMERQMQRDLTRSRKATADTGEILYQIPKAGNDAAQTILGLDPSSTCTGWAYLRRQPDHRWRLIGQGLLVGNLRDDALARVLTMRPGLLALLARTRPSDIIVEMMTEKQYTRQPEKKSGLPVCAMAMGMIFAFCYDWAATSVVGPCKVHPVSNLWTAGSDKVSRQLAVKLQFPNYEPLADKDCDVSDAVSLAMRWAEQ